MKRESFSARGFYSYYWVASPGLPGKGAVKQDHATKSKFTGKLQYDFSYIKYAFVGSPSSS